MPLQWYVIEVERGGVFTEVCRAQGTARAERIFRYFSPMAAFSGRIRLRPVGGCI